MRVAFIPPYALLNYTECTNYQLCLPHLFASFTYKSIYTKYCKDTKNFVIMDNGAAEGKLTDISTLMHLATSFRPNELVIPDDMGDMKGTLSAAMAFYDEVVPPLHMNPLPFGLMFVLQGQTMSEVQACAAWAMKQFWIDTIGIPRHLPTTLGDPDARVHVANFLQANGRPKPIHFLGANSDLPREIEKLSNPSITDQRYVRGMDTSMPFNYAYAGISILKESDKTASRPDKYFYIGEAFFPGALVNDNVNYFLKFHEGVGE